MLKFLRQYNKFLLAGFGSILLLTWLVPSAVTEFSRQSGAMNAAWATLADGTTITVAEHQHLQRQQKVLEAMGAPVLTNLGADPKDVGTWYLLVREARQAGLIGGIGDGQRVLAGLVQQNGGNVKPDQMLGRLCGLSGMQPVQVLETLSELQGVARMLSLATAAARLSDVRLEKKAAEAMSGVAADIAVISAANPLPKDDPTPTPERMQALLKEFGSKAPGSGRGGMGYRQPDRFSLEWFAVPAATVRASLESDPALSGVALRKAFLRNPTQFGAAAGETGAAFDTFKDAVRNAELDRLVAQRMEEISKFVGDQTQLVLRKFPKDGVYAKLPEGVAGVPALAEMAMALASQFKLPAITVEKTAMISAGDLSKMPGLGTSTTTRFGTQSMTIAEVVGQAREFKPEQVRAVVQTGVTGPAMRGPATGTAAADLYVFRVLETVPAHDAKEIDEVRTQLAEDAAKVMRFEALERDRAAIETQAKADFNAVASTYGAKVDFAPGIREADASLLKFGLKMPTALPGLGQDEATTAQIVERALALPQDLAQVPDADRTFVIASPDRMALVAVKVREVFPVTREDYQDAAANARFRASLVGDQKTGQEMLKAFGPDALKQRAGFKPTREEHAEGDAPAEQAPAKAG